MLLKTTVNQQMLRAPHMASVIAYKYIYLHLCRVVERCKELGGV